MSLVAVACSKSSPNTGGDDDATEAPKVWLDAGLPTGQSSVDSLDLTVMSNATATEYQYALFSDAAVTCDAATYGGFKNVNINLTEINLGDNGKKIICIRGRDAQGTVQAEPERYDWTKVDGIVEEEKTGETPHAELDVEIMAADGREKIESAVTGNDITTEYEYVLIEAKDKEGYNCEDIATDAAHEYGTPAKPIGDKLEIEGLANGKYYTLCLRGLDKDGNRQSEATHRTWKKIDATTTEPTNVEDKPRIGLINASLPFISGSGGAIVITVKNVDEGKLQWQATSPEPVSWLEAKVGSGGSYVALPAGEFASGEIEAEGSALVYFRLAKGKGTDYGEPSKREHEITFVNKDSTYEIKVMATLKIPRLEVPMSSGKPATTYVKLSRGSRNPVKVYAKNLNELPGPQALKIEVVPGFRTGADITFADKKATYDKFTQLVSLSEPKLESEVENKGERYVELAVKPDGKQSCATVQQTLFIYSNGDSEGASNCSIQAEKEYFGLGGGGASWTTSRCMRVVVTFNDFDLNKDGKINILDLVAVSSKIGSSTSAADVDGSGTVDKADVEIVSACFGR